MPGQQSDEVRARWDANADFWDERMGEAGNAFHLTVTRPALERLLGPMADARVLEIACGNGLFARRLAELGATVVATDFSAPMLERARRRTAAPGIEFLELDATDPAALGAVPGAPFDAVVCTMALMDMAEVDPLARALPELLVPGGRFVFSTCHPAFNRVGTRFVAEHEDQEGRFVTRRGVFVDSYLTPRRSEGVAMLGQPVTHLYFDRSLSGLLGPFLAAGLVLDGLEEPAFPAADAGEELNWSGLPEFPPVLVGRLRRP
jgi:SAM-dependent methyltransferase